MGKTDLKISGTAPDEAYAQKRERMAAYSREQSKSGRDIGAPPSVVDPERKSLCERDFRKFCETYFPHSFSLEWSPDHLKVIDRIERSVLEGGLFSVAMPRGTGKTTLCETACLWAILYGHREFVALIGSEQAQATQMLDSIKSEIENSDELMEDFPEVCHPIRALEGINQRASGQTIEGVQTRMTWTASKIVLPTVKGSKASGSAVRVCGITGTIRGMKHKRADGTSIRPSLVLIDDPQSDESAMSPSQCATRERVLAGAILGLAGPGQKIAGLMPLTVVRRGDMADRILDREKHPDWQGERTKMVYSFPDNEKLWEEYASIRRQSLRDGIGLGPATDFYCERREEMDKGSEVAWPVRYNHDELSAIQHAMNLKFQDEHAFFAEYQNEPLSNEPGDELSLDAEDIASKLNNHDRGVAPLGCTKITEFIDVQGKALYWCVVGWEDDFTGYVLDYGVYPDQGTRNMSLREVRTTITDAAPGAGQEGAIYKALEALTGRHLSKEWEQDGGGVLRVDRCLIDANWGLSTDVVYQFCRQSPHARTVMPSHGRGIGASGKPLNQYTPKRGERTGLHWRVPAPTGRRAVRHVLFDANYWKTFCHARLAMAMGDPGSLSLYGNSEREHRAFADQLTAEYCVRTEGRGRVVDEWRLRADGMDNHFLDCIVGCAVAASMEGANLYGETEKQRKARRVQAIDPSKRKRIRPKGR